MKSVRTTSEKNTAKRQDQADRLGEADGNAHRILIADDEPTIQLTLAYALRSAGFEVVTASRIETAEAALERYPFSVVLADLRMSGILGAEGLELLTYIKRRWPETKVIIMTAYGTEEIRKQAYDRGAVHYYDKPINVTDLITLLKELAGQDGRTA